MFLHSKSNNDYVKFIIPFKFLLLLSCLKWTDCDFLRFLLFNSSDKDSSEDSFSVHSSVNDSIKSSNMLVM